MSVTLHTYVCNDRHTDPQVHAFATEELRDKALREHLQLEWDNNEFGTDEGPLPDDLDDAMGTYHGVAVNPTFTIDSCVLETPTCSTCQHWDRGECTKVDTIYDDYNNKYPTPKDRMQVDVKVSDDTGLSVYVTTGPDFGCSLHKP